ncbi:MAG TPA: dihydroorotate dehydrogenase electron transfer subunit, partial [Anaerolineae bacterium]|nr:dihydroorotate dehydrogenase electron transfer subunit [Anaerolineae bacterium]
VKTFTLDIHLPKAKPGQFIMVWIPGVDEKPFSLVSATPVSFIVARVGPFTSCLHGMQPGDRLGVRGPLGNGFQIEGAHLLVVGGGYGVAPMYFLAREALAMGKQVSVVVGARTADDLLFARQFQALDVALSLATEDGSRGVRGFVTNAMGALLDVGQTDTSRSRPDSVYACGPAPMLVAIRSLCQERRLPCQLSWENYMRCGIGICGSCERDGWLVCREGPVERLEVK